ncbi:hypothetical protein D3C75_721200 [compost metagenome]
MNSNGFDSKLWKKPNQTPFLHSLLGREVRQHRNACPAQYCTHDDGGFVCAEAAGDRHHDVLTVNDKMPEATPVVRIGQAIVSGQVSDIGR